MIPLKMDDQMIDSIIKRYTDKLKDQLKKLTDLGSSIKFEEKLEVQAEQKMCISCTPHAYLKMLKLLYGYDSEVGWHGTVTRLDDHHFRIDDIIVYPQYVTGATVNTDQEEYADWMMHLEDDVHNSLRFHGHSHVRMAVSPSSVDEKQQSDLVSQLTGDDFYIFAIINKDLKMNLRIYDLKTNMKYDTADIDFCVESPETQGMLDDFEDASAELVKKKTYTAPKPAQTADSKKEQPKLKKDKKKKDDKKQPEFPTSPYGSSAVFDDEDLLDDDDWQREHVYPGPWSNYASQYYQYKYREGQR